MAPFLKGRVLTGFDNQSLVWLDETFSQAVRNSLLSLHL